jgi:multidrug efflux system outer membrane protein
MGQDFHTPDLKIQAPEIYQYADGREVGPSTGGPWWHVFNNPEINKLVEDVLTYNLDIKKAFARVLEVQSQLVQTRADRFPSVGISGDAQKQKRPIIGILPGESFVVRSETYTLSLPATFELDLWGRLARAEEAARANLLQAEEYQQTIVQSVVAEAVSLYLQMEAYERRIQITEESIQNFRRSLALVKIRYERGIAPILDLKQASRILAQAETALPPLRQELGITQQKMAVLMGTYPKTRPPRNQPEDYFKLLDPVPPGLTSELLMNRPDIRAAEAGLRTMNAMVGVAKANRFPRITLTGSFGYTSEELDRLFTPESDLWTLAAGISQPVFDAGKLKAGQRAAEAKYQQGLAEYAKIVLTAFAEVERALLTREEQLIRRDRVLKFLNEARVVQEVAETRYERGLVDYLSVLEAQRTRFEAEQNLVLVDLAIMTNRVSLHRALGTGWIGMNTASYTP